MKNSVIYYSVGALLYCPANNKGISNSVINQKFGNKFSLALCLEDTIQDNCVAEAEDILIDSMQKIYDTRLKKEFFIPKIFIRIRHSSQIKSLYRRLGAANELISGFIFPKFTPYNADRYIDELISVNSKRSSPVYMMPILEHFSIINLSQRYDILQAVKDKLGETEALVLNIRVGGNDLCHRFGFRRSSSESIHSIKPVSSIFSDIATTFGEDYIVSAPVWEYYGGSGWDTGLRNEIREDRLCGFIGKTVIHPRQIGIVNEEYAVYQKDLDDAVSILNWDKDSHSLVSGSISGERMDEFKTHSNWALKTLMLSKAFGIKNE